MSYQRTNPAGALERIEKEAPTVVDVRTVPEFESGHIQGAYNIPLMFGQPGAMEPNPDFVDTVARLFPKDAKLMFI